MPKDAVMPPPLPANDPVAAVTPATLEVMSLSEFLSTDAQSADVANVLYALHEYAKHTRAAWLEVISSIFNREVK